MVGVHSRVDDGDGDALAGGGRPGLGCVDGGQLPGDGRGGAARVRGEQERQQRRAQAGENVSCRAVPHENRIVTQRQAHSVGMTHVLLYEFVILGLLTET